MTEPEIPLPPSKRLAKLRTLAPSGFVFPETYVQMIGDDDLPDIKPLFFLSEWKDDGLPTWTSILRRQFPARVLVPFANDGANDDVYCFDGRDVSGNPVVQVIHSFTTPGWEYRGEFEDFDSWLRALTDALPRRRQDDEEWEQEWENQ